MSKTVVGGYSEPLPVTKEVQWVTLQVEAQFKSQAHVTCDCFTPILYRYQVVQGTNFLIKVQVSDHDYAHLKVFRSLPQENKGSLLVSFQTGKTKEDALEIF